MGSRGRNLGGTSLQATISPTPVMPAPTPVIQPQPQPQPSITDVTDADVPRLQRLMGQNGYEAGDPNTYPQRKLYVNTSKSLNINTYLQTDGATIHNPDSQWDSLGYTPRMVRNDIARIDNGMKPLPENIRTYRYVNGDALGNMLNDPRINNNSIRGLIRDFTSGRKDVNQLKTALLNTKYTHKAYTSTTYEEYHGSYSQRPVRLNMIFTKGTNAIVTNNIAEHEILGHRGMKYNFKDVRVENGQIVIDVTV